MDNTEYTIKKDEIRSLIAQKEYAQAVEIADTVDWRRVRSVMMLCTISDLYKINRRYEDAKNMLLLAYEYRPGGRSICYSLCELCIKMEEFVQAVAYYKEFVQAAPKDPDRYVLQYKLYEAQDVSLEERIEVLKELKQKEYREKWAYELAYLYHRIGQATLCVEECDELILWFGDGKYVYKAMELKMLHQPLSPSQQEKYERRPDGIRVQENVSKASQNIVYPQPREKSQGYEQPKAYEQAKVPVQPQVREPVQGYIQPQGYGSAQGYEQPQSYGSVQGYVQPQGYGSVQSYEQPQGYEQSQVHEQSQGYGSAQGYVQPQGYGSAQGYVQPQGYEQSQGYGSAQGYEQSQGYGSAQGHVQPQGYEQSQGYGSAQGYEQSQGYGSAQGHVQPQGYGQSQGYIQPQGYEQSQIYEQAQAQSRPYEHSRNSEQVREETIPQSSPEPEAAERFSRMQPPYGEQDFEDTQDLISAEAEQGNSDKTIESEIQVPIMDMGQYNTMNLQAEIAAGLQEVLEKEGRTHDDEITRSILAPMLESDTGRLDGLDVEDLDEDELDVDTGEVEETEVFFGETGEINSVRLGGVKEIVPEMGRGKASEVVPEMNSARTPDAGSARMSNAGSVRASDAGSVRTSDAGSAQVSDVGGDTKVFEIVRTKHDTKAQASAGSAAEANSRPEADGSASGRQDVSDVAQTGILPDVKQVADATAALVMNQMRMENRAEAQVMIAQPPKELANVLSQESDGQISLVMPEREAVEKQITGQMSIEDILAEWERIKQENIERRKAELQQRVQQQTGNMFTEFEAAVRDGLLEKLESEMDRELGESPVQGEPEDLGEIEELEEIQDPDEASESVEAPEENIIVAEADTEAEKPVEVLEEGTATAEPEKPAAVEAGTEAEKPVEAPEEGAAVAEPEKPAAVEASTEAEESVEVLEEGAATAEAEKPAAAEADAEAEKPGTTKEHITVAEPEKPAAVEASTEAEEPVEVLEEGAATAEPEQAAAEADAEAEKPGTTKEHITTAEPEKPAAVEASTEAEEPGTAEEHITTAEPEQPAAVEAEAIEEPVAEIPAEPEPPVAADVQPQTMEAEEYIPYDVEAAVDYGAEEAADYKVEESADTGEQESNYQPAEEQERPPVRKLTREERELYAPYIQSRSAREQLVKAIDAISVAAYTGNIVITGEEGLNTITLAKNMIREVQLMDKNFSGKVAKISGQGLNQRNVRETLEELKNGALIIQKASGMQMKTASDLTQFLRQRNKGIIIVLEDTRKGVAKLFAENPRLKESFTARMDVEALSNDTLASFGMKYAREMEYSIDDLGMLALHQRIEELQTIDHVVTVVEVKNIVDKAIRHASKKTVGHFMDVLLAKRYDEEDMIILTEKDFA